MEEEVILRQKFIAHRAQVQVSKKAAEPDDRQQEEQKSSDSKARCEISRQKCPSKRHRASYIPDTSDRCRARGQQKVRILLFLIVKTPLAKDFSKVLGILITKRHKWVEQLVYQSDCKRFIHKETFQLFDQSIKGIGCLAVVIYFLSSIKKIRSYR